MASSAAAALRKFLFFDEKDATFRQSYHLSTSWDSAYLSSCGMYNQATLTPPSSQKVSFGLFATSLVSCALSRNRHHERWWAGGMFLGLSYFICYKFHRAGNGPQGHLLGFWTSLVGIFGFSLRVIGNSGSRSFNLGCMSVLTFMAWYEIGRFHLWSGWWDEFQRVHGNTSKVRESLFAEFVPKDIKTELLAYRRLHSEDDAAHRQHEQQQQEREQFK